MREWDFKVRFHVSTKMATSANTLEGLSTAIFRNHATEHPGKGMKPREISTKFWQVWQSAGIGNFNCGWQRGHRSSIRGDITAF